ncbi:MAG: peptidase domain-containing ABC transporter [Pseudomonadota bacterium]
MPGALRLTLTPPRRRVPVITQAEAAECGLACVAMLAAYHGQQQSLAELRARLPGSLKGATLQQLLEAARSLKLAGRPLRLSLQELPQLRTPCVLHWTLNHFVVLERVSAKHLDLVDPSRGRLRVSHAEADRAFSGVALELQPAPGFASRRALPALALSHFFRAVRGVRGSLAGVLALSLCLQLLVLAAPYYSQLVVDEAIVTGDQDLLVILALGFAALGLWQLVVATTRSWLLLYLGTRLKVAWVVRLFRHLLSLSLSFFQRRHVGDVLSRFGSINAIQNLVTNTTVEALVDGVMALTTLIVLTLYSGTLATLVVALTLARLLIELAFYPATRRAQEAGLASAAAENSHFVETLRALPTLKSGALESMRESAWQNRLIRSINDTLTLSRLGIWQGALTQLVALVERIGVLYVAALTVLAGEMTVGMLMAFMAYRSHFSSAAGGLISTALAFRLVGVHLDRLADIVTAEPETTAGVPLPRSGLQGRIEIRRLTFTFHPHEASVIDNLSLDIRAGECVALAGPSGCGKSTLLKLLLGLLTPDAGEIRVDGQRLDRLDLSAYRGQVGAVLQDDQLLSGSLRDNICLFDPGADEARLRRAIRRAALERFVEELPMGLETLVGDMGSTLSGGQRQRLLLARALYREPPILLLDESSSHLDVATERAINAGLRDLKVTRVLVAHRRETLAMADRVVHLAPGPDQS